jgi:murein DD-endopeptidase MepM/ murein hydrolase activator NlpD
MFAKSSQHSMRFSIGITSFVGLFLLLGVLLARYGLPGSTVAAQSPSRQEIYVPLVMDASVDHSDTPSIADVSQQTEWVKYESQTGGYSFSYPSSYTITEHEQGFVQLRPIDDDAPVAIITLMYLSYEIEPTDDLLEWARLYDTHHKEGAFELDFASVDRSNANADAESRWLYVESTATSPLPIQAFLITNHRLVFRLSAHQPPDSNDQTLRQIAKSLTFSAEAPRDLAQLFDPDPPPFFTSLDEYVEYILGERVLQALNIRMFTGETPTELLEQMSALERRAYETALEAHAELLQELDRQRAEPPPPDSVYSESDYQSYLGSEAEYNQTLPGATPIGEPSSQSDESGPFSTIFAAGTLANCAGIVPTTGLNNRKGLPARYTTPIRTYNPAPPILCGSQFHVNADTYAADISVAANTEVRATTQGETVYQVVNNFQGIGYGRYVRTYSDQTSAGEPRRCYHIYAHLNNINVNVNDVLDPSGLIGLSGCTGTNPCANHLHFGISTIFNGTSMPVDLSPVKGLTPNLNYPAQCATCGHIRNPDNEPIIIESNEFQVQVQPVSSGHYWNCSTYLPNHTGTCYRAAVPISPEWGLAPLTSSNLQLTPKITFEVWLPSDANYYLWVCAMGGSVEDDSLHMSSNNTPLVDPPFGTATDMTGYHSSNWVWRSVRMNQLRPYLYYPRGYRYVNVHARENGLRIDRILLTKDIDYDPTAASIRCGAQNLYD